MRWNRFAGLILATTTGLAFGADYSKGKAALDRGDDEAAAAEFRPLAEAGNADSQFALGWMYENVRLGGQVGREMMKWYQLAADQGHAGAQYSLGHIYQHGWSNVIQPDYGLALQWYQKAAAKGNARALLQMGQMYFRGQGVKADPNRTLELLKSAAASADGDAAKMLGDAYRRADGSVKLPVSIDYPEAIRYYRMAAENGRPDALRLAAGLYERGEGVVKDAVIAESLFRDAAAKGDVVAQYELGKRYRSGLGAAKDSNRARQYLAAASEQGSREAQFDLGMMYLTGEGIRKDSLTAVNYLRRAANEGEPNAALLMARWSLDGTMGVKKDMWSASNYFAAASNGGLAEGSMSLARIKADNDDLHGAIELYLKAAKQGSPEAIHGVDELLTGLPKFQVSNGPVAVREFLTGSNTLYTAKKGELGYQIWESGVDGWASFYFPSGTVLGWLPTKDGLVALHSASALNKVSNSKAGQ